jgi:hypothetical protein
MVLASPVSSAPETGRRPTYMSFPRQAHRRVFVRLSQMFVRDDRPSVGFVRQTIVRNMLEQSFAIVRARLMTHLDSQLDFQNFPSMYF